VGFDLPPFWFGVDYASNGARVVGLLERSVGKPPQIRSLEDGSFVLNVLHLKRAECSKLRRL
jgi:hypothetical protein